MSATIDLEQLKYPIGQFEKPDSIESNHIQEWIDAIQSFPQSVEEQVKGLTKESLQWPYRPEGWTIHQVVHHCADSHSNCLIRFKLALTEENPTIRPYLENKWAELSDTSEVDIDASLKILEGLHTRWTVLLKNLSATDLRRTFVHPEHNEQFSLAEAIGMYSWHCNHHLEHIKQAKHFQGRFE